MEYWRKKFPNNIYDLNYEKLIKNPEIEIKNMIKFCDLEWQDKCLDFHKTKRSIKTLSVAEARKPIYKSSLSGSSNYESYLKKSFDEIKKF